MSLCGALRCLQGLVDPPVRLQDRGFCEQRFEVGRVLRENAVQTTMGLLCVARRVVQSRKPDRCTDSAPLGIRQRSKNIPR
jgi:hypothetical protein